MNFGARSNIPQVQQAFRKMIQQSPFAMSLGLNTLANEFQRVEQELVARNFTLRKKTFIQNSIKRLPQDKSTKQKLVAAVRIDEARDYLAKFEKGGRKVALEGSPQVAIPSKEIKRTKTGVVPKKFYPGHQFGPFTKVGNTIKGAQRTFIVIDKDTGTHLLLQRFGGGRGRHGVRELAIYKESTALPPLLHFYDTAIAVAKAAWARIASDAWRRAMATSR